MTKKKIKEVMDLASVRGTLDERRLFLSTKMGASQLIK